MAEENVEKTYTDTETGKFKPGNPGGGRPKGSQSFSTLYRKAIENIAKSKSITPEEFEVQLVQQAITKGFNGDTRFYADTMDRVHGKAQQHVDHTSAGQPLQVVVPQQITQAFNVGNTNTHTEASGVHTEQEPVQGS